MNTPLFGILATLFAYIISTYIAKKLNTLWLNKFVIAIALIMAFMAVFDIDYETYDIGASYFTFLLPIVVITLAMPLYKNQKIIMKYKWIFLCALVFGVLLNYGLIYVALRFFNLPYELSVAMYTKSISSPMATELHDIIKGDRNIAVLMVIIASFGASVFGKTIIKLTKTKSEIAKGMALGMYSHIIGSTVAFEESEEAGAVAVTTLSLAGVITVISLPLMIDFLL